jgi:nucleoporin POM152
VPTESITDSSGCRRPITSPDLRIEVDRSVPTVQINTVDGRSLNLRDVDSTRIPVRLTGKAPFTITYQLPHSPSRVRSTAAPLITVVANSPNYQINLPSPVIEGEYRLISFRDRFCRGVILDDERWSIHLIPRPSLLLSNDYDSRVKSSVLARGVCQGKPAFVNLNLTGNFVFPLDSDHRIDGM